MGCGNVGNVNDTQGQKLTPRVVKVQSKKSTREDEAQQKAQGYRQQSQPLYLTPSNEQEARHLMTWYHSTPTENMTSIQQHGLGGPRQDKDKGSIATRQVGDREAWIKKRSEQLFAEGATFLGKGVESNELYRKTLEDKSGKDWTQMEILLTPDQVKTMTSDPTSHKALHAGVFRDTIPPDQINPEQEKRAEIAQLWQQEINTGLHQDDPKLRLDRSHDQRAKSIQRMVITGQEKIYRSVNPNVIDHMSEAIRSEKTV